MNDLIKQLLSSNLNHEDVAKLLSDLIEYIEYGEVDDIETIFETIHNNTDNYTYNEFIEEFNNDERYFSQQLEDNLHKIFVDEMGLCPKCGHELNKVVTKEKYEYMGSEITNNEIDCIYCNQCGWKEY